MSGEGAVPAELRILVDTNVWIDAFLGHRSGHDAAMAFLAAAQMASAQLVYPVGALQDVFAILIIELKRKTREVGEIDETAMNVIRRVAWSCVDTLREGATAVGADESDAWLACKYRKLNWDLEDNMVLAAAKRAEVDYLVTSDRVLLTKANVAAMSPADMAALLAAMGREG
ncbi:MAG: PIN domain-containing protein [Coriobacteriia bacterium]|nr:PIN domain-containing protein [Coriobacteriia bacterium]